ncbi:hypothetical protein CVT24_008653 [Panaeolus cyanescens]|uniref:DUF292-domain-containing protein n=1 Tax=Panaeolus cyanescens TaxID=181874 RepID=A0A409VEE9_9AGAR|nr:hypothetical protein CVT24_008653 [Panaeolus cyanescens]
MSSFWNAAKAKVQLRLSVQRLRTLQQKKEAQAKAARREIATLVERGKIETAKIKTEAIIHEDIYVELLEILELYCELLVARFGLLDQNTREPDPGVAEGVCSVIHAAPRTELKELHILREILMHKYGREYSLAAIENRGGCVTSKMTVGTPSPELVDAYLKEIAKAYGVPWSPPGEEVENAEVESTEPQQDDQPKDNEKTADKANPQKSSSNTPEPTKPVVETKKPSPEDDFDILARRFADLKKR